MAIGVALAAHGGVAAGADGATANPNASLASEHVVALTQEHFGRGSAALSPDGKRVAFAEQAGGKLVMRVLDVDADRTTSFELGGSEMPTPGEGPAVTANTSVVITQVGWPTNDRLVFGDSTGGLYLVNADGSARVAILGRGFDSAASLAVSYRESQRWLENLLPAQPDFILIGARFVQFGSSITSLVSQWSQNCYWANIHDGKVVPVVNRASLSGYMLIDQMGLLRGIVQAPENGGWSEVRLEDDEMPRHLKLEAVLGRESLEAWGLRFRENDTRYLTAKVLGFAYNPDILFFASNHDRDTYAVFAADLKNRRVVGPVFDNKEFDVADFTRMVENDCLVFVPEKQTVGGFRYDDVWERTVWRIPEFAAVQKSLDETAPDTVNRIMAWDRGWNRFLVHRFSADDPGAVLLFDRSKGTLRRIVTLDPAIDRQRLGSSIASWVPTRDGKRVLCYLTVPHGTAPSLGRPVVVLLQDQPWGRARWSFDARVEYLADRGYAVLRVNHRGCAGFGLAHLDAGRGRYAEAAIADVQDAVTWTVDKGVADRRRVFIMGESFGGFLALDAVAAFPGLFRGAAVVEPITNPESYRFADGYAAFFDWAVADLARSTPRRTVPEKGKLREMSPVRQAQKIRDPVLFLCAGEGGSKKPSEQTGRMLRALPPGKMDVDLITYDSNLNGSEILRRNLEAALAFFHKHDPGTRPNPNPGEPAPSR